MKKTQGDQIQYHDFENILFHFGIDKQQFDAWVSSCSLTGYPEKPGGSIWTSEGMVLMAIASSQKIKHILEIGTFLGVSTGFLSHGQILNNRAPHCCFSGNFCVTLTTVDIKSYPNSEIRMKDGYPEMVVDDSHHFLQTTQRTYDLIFLDGCHERGHVRREIEIIHQRRLTKNIIFHDYYKENYACQVKAAIQDTQHLFDCLFCGKSRPSDCGLALGILNYETE